MNTGHTDDPLALLLAAPYGIRSACDEPARPTYTISAPVFYLPGDTPLLQSLQPPYLGDPDGVSNRQTRGPTHINPLVVQPTNAFHLGHDAISDDDASALGVEGFDGLPVLHVQAEDDDSGAWSHSDAPSGTTPVEASDPQAQGLQVWIEDEAYSDEDPPTDSDSQRDSESDSESGSEYLPTRPGSSSVSQSLFVAYAPIALGRGKTSRLAPMTRAPVQKNLPARARSSSETETKKLRRFAKTAEYLAVCPHPHGGKTITDPPNVRKVVPLVSQMSVREKAFDPLAKKNTFDFIICGLLASDRPEHVTAIRWQTGSQTVFEIVNVDTFLSQIWKRFFSPARRSFNKQLGNHGFVRVIRRQDCTKGPLLLEKPGLRRDDAAFWRQIRALDVLGSRTDFRPKRLRSCGGESTTRVDGHLASR